MRTNLNGQMAASFFEELKNALVGPDILAYLTDDDLYILDTNASGCHWCCSDTGTKWPVEIDQLWQ